MHVNLPVNRARWCDLDWIVDLLTATIVPTHLGAWLVPDERRRPAVIAAVARIWTEHALLFGDAFLLRDGTAATVWFHRYRPIPPPPRYDERLDDASGEHAVRFRRVDHLLAARVPPRRTTTSRSSPPRRIPTGPVRPPPSSPAATATWTTSACRRTRRRTATTTSGSTAGWATAAGNVCRVPAGPRSTCSGDRFDRYRSSRPPSRPDRYDRGGNDTEPTPRGGRRRRRRRSRGPPLTRHAAEPPCGPTSTGPHGGSRRRPV